MSMLCTAHYNEHVEQVEFNVWCNLTHQWRTFTADVWITHWQQWLIGQRLQRRIGFQCSVMRKRIARCVSKLSVWIRSLLATHRCRWVANYRLRCTSCMSNNVATCLQPLLELRSTTVCHHTVIALC